MRIPLPPSLKRSAAMAPDPVSEPLIICPNCEATNVELYCPRCGQERGAHIAPLREMAEDAAGEFLHWDSKLFATLKGLMKPGFLTVQYLAGRRASYITPFRIYLWVSAIYFLVFSATVQKDVEKQFTPDAPGKKTSIRQKMEQGALTGSTFALSFDREKSAKAQPSLDPKKSKKMQSIFEQTREGMLSVMANMATIMLFVLLLESGVAYLLYHRRQPLFAPHVVTVIHINAALLLLTCPLLYWRDGHGYHNLVTLPIQPVFYFLAFRRLYGGIGGETWAKTLLKTTLFFLVLGMVAVFIMVGVGAVVGVMLAARAK